MPLRLKAVNSGVLNITITEGKAHRKSNATVNTQAPRVFSTGISGKVGLLVAVDMASGTEWRTKQPGTRRTAGVVPSLGEENVEDKWLARK